MGNVIYFDNAATTFPKPECVYKEMDEFYRNYGVNVGRGQHRLASVVNNMVAEIRELLLELFHANNKKIVFTHSATESLNIILQGLINEDNLNVYISPFEHNAVTRVLHAIKEFYNINIHQMPVVKTTLEFDLEALKHEFFANKPQYLIVSHASNVCGNIAPIKEICSLSKQFDCVNVIDMSQTAGLIDIDLSSSIYDFCVFAGHKTLYAPFGIAGFLCSGDIKPKPLMFGGTGSHSANQEMLTEIPEMYEVGSPNVLALAGLNSALKWHKSVGIANISTQEKVNYDKLIEMLEKYDNITIVGNNYHSSIGVISVIFDGYSSQDIGKVFNDNNIAVRTGIHCSPYAHKFLDTFPAGTVRFSVSYFNQDKDFLMLDKVLNLISESL